MTDPVFLVTGQIVAVQNSKGKHFLWNLAYTQLKSKIAEVQSLCTIDLS